MNKNNKIFTISALVLALSACNEGGDSLFNIPGGVSISGDAITGQTLTAIVLDPNGVNESNVSYQWLSGDTEISGATSSSYIITDDELNTTITVTANYTDNDSNDEVVRSAQTSSVEVPPPAFTGDLIASANTSNTAATKGTISFFNIDDSADTLVELTDLASTFGIFNITSEGDWTYTLDPLNASIDTLTSTDSALVDLITLTSVNGVETELEITIVATPTNNIATITDTDDTSLGQLRVELAEAGLPLDVAIEDGTTIAAVESGKMTFKFNAENIGDSSYFAIYGIRTNLVRAMLEFRFKENGKLFVRDGGDDEIELNQTYIEGEWVDVDVTWDTELATASIAPILTLSVDGTPVTSKDGTTITEGTFSSFTTDADTVQYGVTNIKFIAGSNAEVLTGQLSIDDIKIYNDIAGVTTPLVFEEDFESLAVGAIDTTTTIFHINSNQTTIESQLVETQDN